MKKFLLLALLFLLTGCEREPFREIKTIKEPEKTTEKVSLEYVDENPINMGLYTKKNNTYTLLKSYNTNIYPNKDINTFQILPKNDEFITFKGRYTDYVKSTWDSINTNYKMGIILTIPLKDGTVINEYIYDPSNTLRNQKYIGVYLYDAVIHAKDKWYSHITNEEFNENTIITSVKLTAGNSETDINYPIKLSVFTYDTDDDFSKDEYRGQSIYTLLIDKTNK